MVLMTKANQCSPHRMHLHASQWERLVGCLVVCLKLRGEDRGRTRCFARPWRGTGRRSEIDTVNLRRLSIFCWASASRVSIVTLEPVVKVSDAFIVEEPRGGDEGSRGDVPCVRGIAQKRETSSTVKYTRVCYIQTIYINRSNHVSFRIFNQN